MEATKRLRREPNGDDRGRIKRTLLRTTGPQRGRRASDEPKRLEGSATKLTDEGVQIVRRGHFPALAWFFPTGGAGPASVRWRRARLGPALDPGHRDD